MKAPASAGAFAVGILVGMGLPSIRVVYNSQGRFPGEAVSLMERATRLLAVGDRVLTYDHDGNACEADVVAVLPAVYGDGQLVYLTLDIATWKDAPCHNPATVSDGHGQ